MVSKKLMGLLASLLIAPVAWAQTPAVPAAPAPANLWTFMCPTADQKAAWKTCFCNSAIGQMLSGAAGPTAMMSGGLIPNRCLANAIANDMKQPADSPAGAAARAKKDAEDAKARREAVRYLGTLDCNYWPNAIVVLTDALRGDPSECVRFEAALALQSGCCCNEKTVMALANAVSTDPKDGKPCERSERVRAAAADALAHCAIPGPAPVDPDKSQKSTFAPIPTDPTVSFTMASRTPRDEIFDNARAVLAQHAAERRPSDKAAVATPAANQQRRPGSVASIFTNAFAPESHAVVAEAAAPQVKVAAVSEPPMPGTPVSSNGSLDRPSGVPANGQVVSTSMTNTPAASSQAARVVQTPAPRRPQSLYDLLSKNRARPQEGASAPVVAPVAAPQPIEVSSPAPAVPVSNFPAAPAAMPVVPSRPN